MVRLTVAAVSIATVSVAAAEPGVRVGAELGASYVARDDKANDLTRVAPAVAVRLAYGVPDGLAVGLRVGVTRLGFARAREMGSGNERPADRYGEVPID